MKKSTILKMTAALAILFVGYSNSWGQHTVPVPAASGTTLYEKGYNVGSPAVVVATETPDLVTRGTLVPYLVIPDNVLNPGWAAVAATDATTNTGITSNWTWSWTTTPSDGTNTISSTVFGTGHYFTMNITGAANATNTLSVVENGAGCPGAAQTINLRVIAQPTASALSLPTPSICQSGTNGTLGATIPNYTVAKAVDAAIPGNATIRVKATLVFTDYTTGTPTTLFTGAVLNVDQTTGVISVADIQSAASITTFDSWGTYALTINQISDKISRKDLNAVGGYFDINGATGYKATYSVLKTPTTGPIYHLPNN